MITDSPHKINRGEAELEGEKFIIPVGTKLFDPGSWNKEKYTRVSGSAKPLENSDTAEEKPAE